MRPFPFTGSCNELIRLINKIESAFSVAILLGLYPARVLSEKYGRKTTILAGLFLGSAGTATFGFCTTLWSLVVARMVSGFGVSLIPAYVRLHGRVSEEC